MKNVIIVVLAVISLILAGVLFTNLDNIGKVENVEDNATNGIVERNYYGKILATVDGQPVKEQEIKERLNFVMGAQAEKIDIATLTDEQITAISTEVAVQRKVLQKAYDAGVHLDSDLQNRINDLVENIYKEKFLESIAKKGISDGKVKEIYEELVSKAKNSDQYKVKHILVKTEKEANEVRDNLKKSKFEDLAKSKSLDKLSATRGGDLGYIFPEEYVVEFADVVKKLKNNEVSQPVKTQFGWHIVKVEDKRKAEILDIEEAEPRIRKQIGTGVVKKFIEELSKDIKVEIVK